MSFLFILQRHPLFCILKIDVSFVTRCWQDNWLEHCVVMFIMTMKIRTFAGINSTCTVFVPSRDLREDWSRNAVDCLKVSAAERLRADFVNPFIVHSVLTDHNRCACTRVCRVCVVQLTNATLAVLELSDIGEKVLGQQLLQTSEPRPHTEVVKTRGAVIRPVIFSCGGRNQDVVSRTIGWRQPCLS